MKEYHKIQTVFNRDPENKFRTRLAGEFAVPEFAFLANNMWDFTEKVDGTNIRVKMTPCAIEDDKQYGIVFGGKTDAAQRARPD